MSIEQNTTATPAATAPTPTSAIENELPTYRAISPQAVLSLLCGILALLSFAHWIFLIVAVAAIVLGVLAERKIARLSDVLTGRGLAQAGIALGLIFGLSSVTLTVVQDWILGREASKFAKTYEKVLNEGTIEDAFWWGQNPLYREGKTPEELATELRKSRPGPSMFDMEQASLKRLKETIGEGKAKAHFEGIELRGREKLDVYAALLYQLEPAGASKQMLPEEERIAMVLAKGTKRNRRYEWWVEQVGYPYKPESFKLKVAPVDDGHGHAH